MKKRFVLAISCIIVLSGWAAHPIVAATLFFQPQQSSVVVGQRFVVELHLDSEKEPINAVGATIQYDRELLKPLSIIQDSSFLTLWPEEPTINDSVGTVTLTGGVPGGSLVVDGRVVAIEFEALKTGTAWVAAESETSRVLLNDGEGTETDLRVVPATYTIAAVSPFLLTINSTTHPDEVTWYAQTNVAVSWEPRTDALYSYILTTDPTEQPDGQPEDTDGTATFSEQADGLYYFILAEKLPADEWVVVGQRTVLIDATAPHTFQPRLSTTVRPGERVVVFAATDDTSGIARYEVVDGTTTIADATSPYRLLNQQSRGTIVVRAYDRAGNLTEGVLTIATTQTSSRTVGIIALISLLVLGLVYFLLRRSIRH